MTSLTKIFYNNTAESDIDPLQKSLINLWAKIEKKQKRNQKFLDDKDSLFAQFQTKILPLEQQQGRQRVSLVEFLIPFLTRKSISEHQRDELISWIESSLDYLRSHPFLADIDHEDLQTQFNAAFATFMQSQDLQIDEHQIENVRMEIEHMFDGNLPLSDEEIIALIKDPSLLNQYLQRMDKELDDANDAQLNKEPQSEHSSQHNDPFEDFSENDFKHDDAQQDAKQKSLDKVFKAGQLNKIYKRLASLLHPDKELDPAKKEQKHVLMQTLSTARKNKDAFTLLQLYQTHINDGEFGFDTDTLSSMQTLLREKLDQLDDELYHVKSSNDLSTLVWRKFSGRSKKQTENNFNIHVSSLEEDMDENQFIMQENKTVAQMKKLLQERVEENRGWVSDMPIDLMDLFE